MPDAAAQPEHAVLNLGQAEYHRGLPEVSVWLGGPALKLPARRADKKLPLQGKDIAGVHPPRHQGMRPAARSLPCRAEYWRSCLK